MRRFRIFLVAISVFALIVLISSCSADTGQILYPEECLTSYDQDVFPVEKGDLLSFDVVVTVFTDSVNGVYAPEVREMFYPLIGRFLQADITFVLGDVIVIDNKQVASNMESYKEHAKEYLVDSAINIFVYPASTTIKNQNTLSGIAGGVPAMFFAIRADFIGEDFTTATHEMGHVFGLYHTHQSDRSEEKYGLYDGDFVCDTPASYSLRNGVTIDCKYVGRKARMSSQEIDDLVHNIMSYSYPACRDRFTDIQIKRMRFIVATSLDLRKALR